MTENLSMMNEVIAALDAATGPSRELDILIANAVFPKAEGVWLAEDDPWQNDEHDEIAPGYTSSLDVALTLVPEDWNWTIGRPEMGRGCADLVNGQLHVDGQSVTPVLALCIAALKLKVSLGELDDARHN